MNLKKNYAHNSQSTKVHKNIRKGKARKIKLMIEAFVIEMNQAMSEQIAVLIREIQVFSKLPILMTEELLEEIQNMIWKFSM